MKPKTFKTLDVRPLLAQGTDPFETIRAQIATLAANQGLTVIAPFLPAPLIEFLKGEGFSSAPTHRSDGAWVVEFWRE